jgi:predicted nucleic acid-binding protein
MRRYLLDTTPLTAYLHDQPSVVALVQPWLRRRETATSILVYGEVLEYLKGLDNYPRRRAQLRRLLRVIVPLFVTDAAMEQYADLRRLLRTPHGPGLIGDMDTLIAATALTNDLILVTTDTDFDRVPGLRFIQLDRMSFATVQQRGIGQ